MFEIFFLIDDMIVFIIGYEFVYMEEYFYLKLYYMFVFLMWLCIMYRIINLMLKILKYWFDLWVFFYFGIIGVSLFIYMCVY